MDISDAVDSVSDPESFLEFARLLTETDCNKTTVDVFLSAALAWADSTEIGKHERDGTENPWQRFARFLYAGKVWE